MKDFPDYVPPEETGSTFEENAVLKATHAATHLKKWTLADDSGLVVPALKGAPGVFSARFAGVNATDSDNRKKLLKEMERLDGLDRSGYFECVLALASPKEGIVKCVSGRCEGTIGTLEKGRNGFGYDSLFMKHNYKNTFGELTEELKNKVSHRAKAISKLLPTLERIESRAFL